MKTRDPFDVVIVGAGQAGLATSHELGFPVHDQGASTVTPGLYFVGVPFLRNRKSAFFLGVGDDARIVADSIAAA